MRFLALAAFVLLVAPEARAAPPTQDDGGRAIALPARVERVYPAGPPASIDLFIVAPEKLLGFTRGTHPADDAFVPQRVVDLPELGRITGRGNTANLEAVIGARPDLILDVGTVNPTYVSLADEVQAQTKIPYVLINGGLAETPATLRKLGAVLGAGERGDALARYADDTIAEIRKRVAAVPAERRPAVYLARGPRGLLTTRAGAINAEALDIVGARNVAAAPGVAGSLMDVSMEQVLQWQPEIIVTIDQRFFADVWSDPAWQQVKAVAAHRVYLSPRLPFQWVDEPPAANRIIGLRWLAKLLYPEQFPEDLRAEVRRFYELFYQRAPTDAQLDALLSAAAPPH